MDKKKQDENKQNKVRNYTTLKRKFKKKKKEY